MKIITYSDLHLEFGTHFQPPQESDADLVILAGDIITFKDFTPLGRFLNDWNNPVLYVAGNHEYYTGQPMKADDAGFQAWLKEHHQNVTLLQDEAITIDGVHFFGGCMWTNFSDMNQLAMNTASQQMNDYRLIKSSENHLLEPIDTVAFHKIFVQKLLKWFAEDLSGPRVVISHHAPVENPNTQYGNSPLMPAFNSLDMQKIIEAHQPDLWLYGHTHECDEQVIGKTRIISNQRGYPNHRGGFECSGFDEKGKMVKLQSKQS